jgi:nitrite reductase/ring-hydroxylating ferredoxin subunit
MGIAAIVEKLESAKPLDPPARLVATLVRRAVSPKAVKEAVSGTWLGHAVHPILTDMVIGSFVSASVLDLVGGDDDGRASERLIAVGIVAYPPTALTGASDWSDSERASAGVRRVGLVHAASNALALSLYTASLVARRRGARKRGVALGAGGAAALMTGGYLGGHLTLAQGVGADQTVFDPGPTEWTAAADPSVLPEGRPTRVVVDETPVMLLREGERFSALHDRCSHRGCSLSEGTVEGDEIVCPCHGSRFALRDGSLRAGPATRPQPALEVRLNEGRLELRVTPSEPGP